MIRRLMTDSFALRSRRVAAAQFTHSRPAAYDLRLAAGRGARQQGFFKLLGDQFRLHRLQSDLEFGLLGVESDALELSGDLGNLASNAFGAFLFPAHGTHQYLAAGGEDVRQRHPLITEDQLAYLSLIHI